MLKPALMQMLVYAFVQHSRCSIFTAFKLLYLDGPHTVLFFYYNA